MGLTRQLGDPAKPAPEPKKTSAWRVGGVVIIGFVALLYLVELFDQLSDHQLDRNGIRPLEADGLWGIVFAPVLHAGWGHLAANTGPALVLGFLVTLAGLSRFGWATAIVWVVGGFGTWLIGNLGSSCGETDHIGASGLIFGWLTFLLVFGFFIRSFWQMIVGIAVLLLYGGVLWGLVPVAPVPGICGGVSWQGHLSGAVAGVFAAYLLSGPERGARAAKKAPGSAAVHASGPGA